MEIFYGHPNELSEDFGFANLGIISFIDKLVEDTKNGSLVWTPMFDKNIMWDKLNDWYVPYMPLLRCRIGKHYLYARLSDSMPRFDDIKFDLKSIEYLYTMKHKNVKIYSMPCIEDYVESDYWIDYDKYLFELYQSIEGVHGDLFKVYRQKRALPRVEILNKFFDLMYQKSDECLISSLSTDNFCHYKDYMLACFYGDVLLLERNIGKHHYEFQFRKEAVDSLLRDAYGDVECSAFERRFEQLFHSFEYLYLYD